MDKVTIEVAADRDLAEEAARRGCDLGVEGERVLTRRLRATRLTPDEDAAVRLGADSYAGYVDRHGSFADEWRRF